MDNNIKCSTENTELPPKMLAQFENFQMNYLSIYYTIYTQNLRRKFLE